MKMIIYFLVSLFPLSLSLYTNLSKNKKKCFYDHFYEDMNIILNYKILQQDKIVLQTKNDYLFYITVVLKSEKKLLHTFNSGKLVGKFSFHIDKSEEYKICIIATEPELFATTRTIKMAFSIETNEDTLDNTKDIANMKDYEKVNEKISQITKKAENVERMQEYQVRKEEIFSTNQISNSNRIALMTMIQIGIILLIGGMHIYTLRKLLKEKTFRPF